MSELMIRETHAQDRELRELIAKLDEDLYQRYPDEEVFTLDLDEPAMKDVTFIVAAVEGKAIGCGAVRPLDEDCAELKRFFVAPAFRRRGIASQMLSYLEHRAAERGFRMLRLETGEPQPEAIALYRNFGYEPIAPYGEYVHCKSSRCFEKRISIR